ncbi:ABC transporter substrate-binding protein [Rhizobium chutanense]|uniref:ABC transporter substrate-binding protein n=1 Tax=Rhizobium chutanense TaxID=2035448 RepID=A0A432P626_9HYPH|nr:ABC transporter substrate-binding protein [Rhizobium chutanense]RUM07939.1 ABC transporter substrate-binding protein [Rhizobium chutanense]
MKSLKMTGALLALAMALASGTALAADTLRIKPSGDVKALDPHLGSDSMARNYGYMVYDTLFAMDASLAIKPQMVDTWSKSDDGKTYTFTLREGLKFSDGSPVTSADVIASLKRWSANDSLGQQLVAKGAKWTAEDDRRFTLTLSESWGLVLDALGKAGAPVPFIMPARIADATPANEAVKDHTGSGPFIFLADEWVPGAKLAFAKNPYYVPRSEEASGLAGGKVVKIDRVEWMIIPDQQTALDALRKGEIDIDEDLAADLIPLAKEAEGVAVANQDDIGVAQQIRLNTIQPPFNNPLLRKALLTAVNGDDFLAAVITDASLGKACQSFYSCSSPYVTKAGFPTPDLEKARALVAESGYDGTPAVLLDATENANIHAFVTVTDQLLKDIGIKTRVEAMDWATVTSRRQSKEPVDKGGWSIFVSGPGGLDFLEPVGHLGLRSNCEKAWFGWPCDEQIETMRTQFASLTDQAQRKALAEKIQLRAVETVPYVPIGSQYQIRAYRDNLTGILTPPAPVYWNIARK